MTEKKTDNYQISRDRAQRYFLSFDQGKIISDWGLRHDGEHLCIDFLGRPYGICRSTGAVTRLWSGEQAGFEEVLSIFDLLCHDSPCKAPSGAFAPVNSLRGRPKAAGVETNFYSAIAGRFDRAPDAFARSSAALGGTPVNMGDLGFRFPVFGGLEVILKFYHSDEDFPASLTLLWDENMLQYVFYETVFYIAGFLLKSIEEGMK